LVASDVSKGELVELLIAVRASSIDWQELRGMFSVRSEVDEQSRTLLTTAHVKMAVGRKK
jgi:hypothetical protein